VKVKSKLEKVLKMEVEKLASVKIDTSFEEFCSDGCKGVGW
jgi:hypothetical protein